MGQFIFFALFVITLLVGAFAYFAPLQKPVNPVKFMMDNSGYTQEESTNRKRTQQLNMTTSSGLIQIHKQMDDLAVVQNKFLDTIQDQQQVLQNTGKEASDIMLLTQQEGEKGDKDILKLKALASEMQDEQRLLVAHGQELLVLNDQLTKSRQWIADQVDLANINNESSLNALQQRYTMLKDQASGFFDKVTQHNQEVRDRMTKMQDQLNDLANNASSDSVAMQQQNIKERIAHMLDKERADMVKLADNEDASQSLMNDSKQHLEDSKELLNVSLQRSQDLIEDERQKAEDQQEISQQRVADQMQRIQDQRNR
jgi:hypothetical protein